MSAVARLVGSLGARVTQLARGRRPDEPAQPVAFDAAPGRWRDYAHRVSRCLREVLDGPDAAAARSRAAIDGHANARALAGDAVPVLRLRIWLDAAGAIARVAAGPEHEGTDADARNQADGTGEGAAADGAAGAAIDAALAAALVGREIGAVPPRGMPQPVVVRLRFAGEA
ncbi:hypothetical protein [Burkholderia plantarii]|uniref:hypothetical protein n=1 Tax=Burkholderia plantarii TaxID=41899 RepID=UPI0006D8C0FF|nr:hypothetical protein [Burkholderia plantarii]ALK34207.1 hypothetical protein bpln_2g19930 [Burkholderia plantarii]GLZ20666.1 hypothetical protein Bpla01_41950 [Burkholderia plantarii]